MNRVKRWEMTMTSWVDGVLAQIENHEANVDAAIVRVRKSTARARVQLRRVGRDQTTLRDTLAAEDEAMSAWLRRAETTEGEDAALERLRRAKLPERHSAEAMHGMATSAVSSIRSRPSSKAPNNPQRSAKSFARCGQGITSAVRGG